MGATASRNDDFTGNNSDPHHFHLSSSQDIPPNDITPIDPDNNDDDDFSIAELKWNFGGHSVYVTGAWDGWQKQYALYRTHQNEFTAVLLLPVGTFQYKFIVDGNWRHNPSFPTERDAHGNLNNVITIVARPKQFDSNDSPHDELISHIDDNYDFSILPQEDHASDPPALPRMLTSVPLDRYSRPNASTPDFVRLNHVFETDTTSVYGPNQVRTVATEFRYKSKVITTVLITSKSKLIPPIPCQPQPHHHLQPQPQHQQHLHHQQQQQQIHPQQQQQQIHHHQHQHQQQQPQHQQQQQHQLHIQHQPYHNPSTSANLAQSESQSLLMDAFNNV